MRKIISDFSITSEEPIDISRVDLEYVHVVAINKFSPKVRGFVLRYTDGLGLVFPSKQVEFNSANNIKEKDLPSLIKRLKNDYDFYVL